ncbi:MAG: hypothetical protein HY815_06925 [Candidatus Riflebacteria bacterium]|nr:hypothetical protein [Candidatus Riflebacteria bacterium]
MRDRRGTLTRSRSGAVALLVRALVALIATGCPATSRGEASASPRPGIAQVGPIAPWSAGDTWNMLVYPKILQRGPNRDPLGFRLGTPSYFHYEVTRIHRAPALTMIFVQVSSMGETVRPYHAGLVFGTHGTATDRSTLALAKLGVRFLFRGVWTEHRTDYFKMSSEPAPVMTDQDDVPLDFPLVEARPIPPGRTETVREFRITQLLQQLPFARDIRQTVRAGEDLGRSQLMVPTDPKTSVTVELQRMSDKRTTRMTGRPSRMGRPWSGEAPDHRKWSELAALPVRSTQWLLCHVLSSGGLVTIKESVMPERARWHHTLLVVLVVLLSGTPGLAQDSLEDADPLTRNATVTVPSPSSEVRDARPADEGGIVLMNVASDDQRGQGTITDARTWYDASSSSSTAGLPIVRQPAQLVKMVPDSRRPWSSHWWPATECALAFPGKSAYRKPHGLAPLEAYDTYVFNKTGKNPEAALWEAKIGGLKPDDPRTGWNYHNLAPLSLYGPDSTADRERKRNEYYWYGHCNAWTAASILIPEPPTQKVVPFDKAVTILKLKKRIAEQWTAEDDRNAATAYVKEEIRTRELTLTRADLIGIMIEACMGVGCQTFGQATGLPETNQDQGVTPWQWDRFRAGETVPLGTNTNRNLEQMTDWEKWYWRNPFPHNFHLILLSKIVDQGLPIAGDIDANDHVDNQPIYGYAYKRNYMEEGDKRFYLFHARTRCATYSRDPSVRGTIPRDVDYYFRIYLDKDNRIASSEWVGPSGNPRNATAHWDVLWFPNSFHPGTFIGNRNLSDSVVRELIKLYSSDTAD